LLKLLPKAVTPTGKNLRSNPNSKRGRVRIALASGGEKVALRIGAALKIPEAKVRRWIRRMTTSKVPTPASSNRKRVKLTYDRSFTGIVLDEGPEVSDVRFDDGVRRFIPNKHLASV